MGVFSEGDLKASQIVFTLVSVETPSVATGNDRKQRVSPGKVFLKLQKLFWGHWRIKKMWLFVFSCLVACAGNIFIVFFSCLLGVYGLLSCR